MNDGPRSREDDQDASLPLSAGQSLHVELEHLRVAFEEARDRLLRIEHGVAELGRGRGGSPGSSGRRHVEHASSDPDLEAASGPAGQPHPATEGVRATEAAANLARALSLEQDRTVYLEQQLARRIGEMRLHRDLMQAFLNAHPDALVAADADGRISLFSPGAVTMFGWSADDANGRDIGILMPSPMRERHREYILRYAETGEARMLGRRRTVLAQRRNGELFAAELSLVPFADNDPHRFLGIVRDLTKLGSREQPLVSERQAQLAAYGVTGTLAHEISQPVSAISTYLQILRDEVLGNDAPDGEELLETVGKATDQVKLVSALIARLGRSPKPPDESRQPLDLNDLIQQAVAAVLIGRASPRPRLKLSLAAPLPAVNAVGFQLQEVLVNLLRNGIEAVDGHRDPQISVTTRQRDDRQVEILVEDNGPGVPGDAAAQIFEPFMTTKRGGTGLGLPICKAIVEAHGGTIDFANGRRGGAMFRVVLPAMP